jgi:transcription antitermination factor NusG
LNKSELGPTVRELCPEIYTGNLEREISVEESSVDLRASSCLAPWYAVSVKHQHEHAVRSALEFKGYEVFLPTCRVKKRWSDRVKQMEVPLFGGYLFSRIPLEQRISAVDTPGVIRLVGFNGKPAPVAEHDIAAIQQALQSELPVRPWPKFEAGARVRIERGPLRGLEGVVVREKNGYQLVIGVEMLCRFMAVELDPEMVTAAPARALRAAV